MADVEQPINIPVDWGDVQSLPTMAANMVLVQQSPHEFTLSFGYAMLPVFEGQMTPERIKNIKSIPAKPFVKISMSPGRVVELLQVLQEQIAAYQQGQKH
jgi:hypothetical protein